MATFFHHTCDTCGYEFDTSGPHEFYRDKRGRVADYGHPVPCSREARESGVSGFYGKMWCLKCDASADIVLREFREPVGRDEDIWTPGQHPEKDVTIACTACGDETPILGEAPLGREVPCPRCGGRIICRTTAWS